MILEMLEEHYLYCDYPFLFFLLLIVRSTKIKTLPINLILDSLSCLNT